MPEGRITDRGRTEDLVHRLLRVGVHDTLKHPFDELALAQLVALGPSVVVPLQEFVTRNRDVVVREVGSDDGDLRGKVLLAIKALGLLGDPRPLTTLHELGKAMPESNWDEFKRPLEQAVDRMGGTPIQWPRAKPTLVG